MLKAVFIGSHNEFDEILVHRLSQRVDVVGVVWTNATAWRQTRKGTLEFARKRLKRYGPLKVINETLYHLYFHAFLQERDAAELQRDVIDPYRAAHGDVSWRGDCIFTTDVNASEVLHFMEERQPDIGLAMCIHNYFGKRLREIPKLGVFLWHEAFTPEYKGLYSPFWAVHNLDFERLGYTLLLMNDELDAGDVYVQGPAVDIDPFRHNHLYVGHKAVMDSLPAVEDLFGKLEAGTAVRVDRSGSRSQTYTYPGISDLVRQRVRLRRFARAVGQASPAISEAAGTSTGVVVVDQPGA